MTKKINTKLLISQGAGIISFAVLIIAILYGAFSTGAPNIKIFDIFAIVAIGFSVLSLVLSSKDQRSWNVISIMSLSVGILYFVALR